MTLEEKSEMELRGTIKGVKRNTSFTLTSGGSDYVCQYKDFFLGKEGDIAFVRGNLVYGTSLVVTDAPYVLIPDTREATMKSFLRHFRYNGGPHLADKLYNAIEQNERRSGRDLSVAEFLSDIAERYDKYRDPIHILEIEFALTKEKAPNFTRYWFKEYTMRRIYLLGINKTEVKNSNLNPGDFYERCLKNPFSIASISMEKSRDILSRQGLTPTKEQEICGQAIKTLNNHIVSKGWTCTPSSTISRAVPDLHRYREPLVKEYGVIMEDLSIYLSHQCKVETEVAKFIIERMKSSSVEEENPPENKTKDSKEIEEEDLIRKLSGLKIEETKYKNSSVPIPYISSGLRDLSEDQVEAVKVSLSTPISIITGGAGTGKTTVINELIFNFEKQKLSYLLCSFTGKAVARIKEVTGKGSSTIHRFLYAAKEMAGQNIPVIPDVIIIDEVSMVTCELFYELICSIRLRLLELKGPESYERSPYSPRIVMVGDCNQLPPIGWGSLLEQCLKSRTIPVSYLIIDHRSFYVEGETNGIALNASAILNQDEGAPLQIQETSNFRVVDGTIKEIETIVGAFKNSGIGTGEFKILSPFNAELDSINRMVQRYYTTSSSYLEDRGSCWFVGDRVIMTENNYTYNIMNGEEGVIQKIGKAPDGRPALQVLFDLKEVLIPVPDPTAEEKKDEEEGTGEFDTTFLQLSYALTVHKSQGSEWNYIIFYIKERGKALEYTRKMSYNSNNGGLGKKGDFIPTSGFLNRNLFYTAITRAKRVVYVIGEQPSIIKACKMTLPYRCENLDKKLQSSLSTIGEAPGIPIEEGYFLED